MGSVPMGQLRVTQGAEFLTLYQWNTRVAEHYFCKVCGIYTHHRRRSAPDEYGFNVACLEGDVDIDESALLWVDGAAASLVDK